MSRNLDGMYLFHLRANGTPISTGVCVIDGETIRGGDAAMLMWGSIKLIDSSTYMANVSIKEHTALRDSLIHKVGGWLNAELHGTETRNGLKFEAQRMMGTHLFSAELIMLDQTVPGS